MNKILLSLAGLLLMLKVSSQGPLGTWTSYLPYNKGLSLAITENRIFCSTTGGLFYYDKADNSIQKFSKEDGLSDFEISTLGYCVATGTLIVAYSDANLDLITGNQIFNLPDIKRKQILGDKQINDIHFIGSDAYLACGFGIVKLDVARREIRETYLIGSEGMPVKVNSITHLNDELYAATDQGLYVASLNSPNLIDFRNWQRITEIPESGYRVTSLAAAGSHLFANLVEDQSSRDVVYVYDGQNWQMFQDYEGVIVNHLSSHGKKSRGLRGKIRADHR